MSLDEISERVGDFKEKWGDHTSEVVSHIRRTIEQLEKDLTSLADRCVARSICGLKDTKSLHSMQEVVSSPFANRTP